VAPRSGRTRLAFAAVLVLLMLALAGCGPEADRFLGGDDGADIDNRDAAIEMHGDDEPEERIYYGTPKRQDGD